MVSIQQNAALNFVVARLLNIRSIVMVEFVMPTVVGSYFGILILSFALRQMSSTDSDV
jgi:hypothetical protein